MVVIFTELIHTKLGESVERLRNGSRLETPEAQESKEERKTDVFIEDNRNLKRNIM